MVSKSVLLVAVDNKDNPEIYLTDKGHTIEKAKIWKDIMDGNRVYNTLDKNTRELGTVKAFMSGNIGSIQDESEGNNLRELDEFDL